MVVDLGGSMLLLTNAPGVILLVMAIYSTAVAAQPAHGPPVTTYLHLGTSAGDQTYLLPRPERARAAPAASPAARTVTTARKAARTPTPPTTAEFHRRPAAAVLPPVPRQLPRPPAMVMAIDAARPRWRSKSRRRRRPRSRASGRGRYRTGRHPRRAFTRLPSAA
jgi:hypothetical protein